MPAFDFPNSPSNGQTYSANGIDWIYNGSVWKKDATAGVKGQKGEVAEKGQKGEKGEVGQKGDKGDKGDKGQKGEIGATGGSGGVGNKGDKGDTGQKGQTGADNSTKGQKGQKGDQGTSVKGEPGASTKGDKGTAGVDATKGQKGEKGQQGSGSNGTDGDKGQKGDTGGAGSSVPSGGIIIWSGAANAIPSGWYLCNGSNGTPDLRNRFVIGAHSDGADSNWPNLPPGNTGGSNVSSLVSHSHTINNHTHSFSVTTGSESNHFHYTMYAGGQNGTGGTGGTGRLHNRAGDNVAATTSSYNTGSDPRQDAEIGARSGNAANAGRSNSTGGHSHSVSGTTGNPSNTGTNSQGSAGDKSNLPPYYALCYIMKS